MDEKAYYSSRWMSAVPFYYMCRHIHLVRLTAKHDGEIVRAGHHGHDSLETAWFTITEKESLERCQCGRLLTPKVGVLNALQQQIVGRLGERGTVATKTSRPRDTFSLNST